MRKTNSALPLLIVLTGALWATGCSTTTSSTPAPAFAAHNLDLKGMFGGQIGDQLSAAQPGLPTEPAGVTTRRYEEWQRNNRR